MSHQVQINYRQIAVQCDSVCEVAEAQLKSIDELLEKAKEHSKTLLGVQTASLKRLYCRKEQSLLSKSQS